MPGIPSKRKIWMFRLAAVLLGISPLLLLEFALQTVRWQASSEIVDPFVGFSEVRPLFVKSEDGTQFQISPERYPLFRPDSFAATKDSAEFRIFCLGGSTVQGRPFAIETSFTTWLELSLEQADRRKVWQVINCGGVSYASYRLVPIMKEIVRYQPDLIIVYTGHNEFLEDRTYDAIKNTPGWISYSHEIASNLKSYQFVRSLIKGANATPASSESFTVMPAEAEARLDFRGGLEKYHRDTAWQESVIRHYELNLRSLIEIAKRHQVPLLFCNPVSNLRDTPPFKSQHTDGLSAAELDSVERIERVLEFEPPVAAQQAIESLTELIAIDPLNADAHYRLAEAYHRQSDFSMALHHFLLAKDYDICPLRMLEPMHRVLVRVCKQTETPLVDIRAMFEQRAADGIPGRESLIDHVHPTIFGHQLIAERLVEQLAKMGYANTTPDWETDRDASYQAYLKTLPFMYFQRGLDRLEGLQRWSEGKVTREPGSQLKFEREPIDPVPGNEQPDDSTRR